MRTMTERGARNASLIRLRDRDVRVNDPHFPDELRAVEGACVKDCASLARLERDRLKQRALGQFTGHQARPFSVIRSRLLPR